MLNTVPDTSHVAIQIRAMHLVDAEAVAHLTGQLGYDRTARQVAEWLAHLLANPNEQAAFVASLNNEIVGWIEVSVERRLQSASFGMIGGLVVSDHVRSRGIGRLLCQCAEQWTWEQGLDMVRVTSRSTRAGAHRFYLRDGYKEVKTSFVFEKHRPPDSNPPET